MVRITEDLEEKKKNKLKPVKLFTNDGRPLNINQGRIPFKLNDDDESGCKILDVSVYKYLDTSLVNVDLHPRYVTINIKGKILQITFDEDICVDKSSCQRSQTTGHLLITMPKANAKRIFRNRTTSPRYGF
ncbi:testis specific leucine rich repeat protein, putative [Pediculus humanus corporis]|uniref:Testis specific leucine rich repeat protein, putative n=1 Tax=Pediculus humanus subsp. corporis TaxID=121224 RepID=E0VIS7_PEDHC|nr:testis specific leucine rich repeat protein, putative [Pediculus humanus corporis]EEB13283.1 testis specific leucine rich repeat protein, putative [Pediculus humanus corporis]